MKVLRNIYKFISENIAVFLAFLMLMILSASSLFFTFNFILNVMQNNDVTLNGGDVALLYLKEGGIISGFMLISVFNLAYVYSYVLDTRKREIAISRISGQTMLSAVGIFYLEMLVLSSFGYIISLIGMKLIVFPLISERGFMFVDSLNVPQCIMLYLILIFIYSIVFLPSIIIQIRKSPAEALADGE